MPERTWPADWEARKQGEGCPFCDEGRVDENEYGTRFFAGGVSDAYLQRSGPARGYAIVVFRGRHASDLIDLNFIERSVFWAEVRTAARAIERVFEPCHLNYQALGNAVPHVHVHVVPRYLDDASPAAPLSFDMQPVLEGEFQAQLSSLRSAVAEVDQSYGGHHGLTADMFVVRGDRFLVLTRRGFGEGVEYIPGGVVDAGEDPYDAAIREAKEETSLDVRDVTLLRAWTYTSQGWETVHATYVGYSDAGDVVITDEHSGHRWVTPDEHIERWCSEELEERFPPYATFFRQVRTNCELVRSYLG